MALALYLLTFTIFVVEPTHKNSITKPVAQQYALNQSDPIWFYKPDEIGWTRGEVVHTWGYYPEIHSKELNKTFQFHEVEWITGYE